MEHIELTHKKSLLKKFFEIGFTNKYNNIIFWVAKNSLPTFPRNFRHIDFN